jgi:ABC-2 type transport system permease protein
MSVITLPGSGRSVTPLSAIAAERIKLASTRSPWWCAAAAAVGTSGLAGLVAFTSHQEGGPPVTVATTQLCYAVGMAIVMVMATLSVTGEHSVGTIRTTFLAVPRRGLALGAKAVVVAVVAAVVGAVGAFGGWALSAALLPGVDLSLAGPTEWRQVAGVGLVYVAASVIAVAVGALVRHTAGAVSLVLVWALMAEQLIAVVPGIGPAVAPWLPFQAGKHFLTAGVAEPGAGVAEGPWFALGYLAVVAAALLAVAIAVANRRDA